MVHRVVHVSLKLVIAMLVLISLQFINLGISENEYGAFGIVPIIGVMILLLFKTIYMKIYYQARSPFAHWDFFLYFFHEFQL